MTHAQNKAYKYHDENVSSRDNRPCRKKGKEEGEIMRSRHLFMCIFASNKISYNVRAIRIETPPELKNSDDIGNFSLLSPIDERLE